MWHIPWICPSWRETLRRECMAALKHSWLTQSGFFITASYLILVSYIFFIFFKGYDFLEVELNFQHKYFENRLFFIMLAISVVTRLWIGQLGNQALILGKGGDSSHPHIIWMSCGSHPGHSIGTGGSSPRERGQRLKLTPLSIAVEVVWKYTFTPPYIFVV
jgi:hypothetical protein